MKLNNKFRSLLVITSFLFSILALSCESPVEFDNLFDPDNTLPVPDALYASIAGENSISLQWRININNIDEKKRKNIWTIIEQYKLYKYEYHENQNKDFKVIDTLKEFKLSAVIPQAISPDTSYYYRIRIIAGKNKSAYSNIANIAIYDSWAPSELSANFDGDGYRVLKWKDKSTSEVQFTIYRKLGINGVSTQIGHVPANTTTYTDSSTIITDTTYYYSISADFSNGTSNSGNSIPVLLHIGKPDELQMIPVSSTSVNLEWKDDCNVETAYKVFRSVNSQNFDEVAALPANSTSYVVNDLNISNAYKYKVAAVTQHYAKYSNEISISYGKDKIFTFSGNPNSRSIKAIALSPDSRYIVYEGSSSNLEISKTFLGKKIAELDLMDNPTGIKFSQDSKKMAVSYWTRVSLVNFPDLSSIYSFGLHDEDVAGFTLSPDGKRTSILTNHPEYGLWDIATNKLLKFYVISFSSNVKAGDISPDNKYLAEYDDALNIVDLSNGETLHRLDDLGYPKSILYHPSGNYIAYLGTDNNLKFLDAFDGHILRQTNISGDVSCIAFNSEGSRIAAGRTDGNIDIIDFNSGAVLTTFNDGRPVNTVSFSPTDNNLFVTGGEGNAVNLYSLSGIWKPDR